MPKIVIRNVTPQVNGEYELDTSQPFTNRELHLIKQQSGVRVLEMQDALRAGDSDVFVCFALIALQRAGRGDARDFADLLWDAPAGSIDFDFTADKQEAAAPPDASVPPSLPPSEPDASGGSEKTETASGSGTSNAGEPSPVTPLRSTGTD